MIPLITPPHLPPLPCHSSSPLLPLLTSLTHSPPFHSPTLPSPSPYPSSSSSSLYFRHWVSSSLSRSHLQSSSYSDRLLSRPSLLSSVIPFIAAPPRKPSLTPDSDPFRIHYFVILLWTLLFFDFGAAPCVHAIPPLNTVFPNIANGDRVTWAFLSSRPSANRSFRAFLIWLHNPVNQSTIHNNNNNILSNESLDFRNDLQSIESRHILFFVFFFTLWISVTKHKLSGGIPYIYHH